MINRIWEKNKTKPFFRVAQRTGGFACSTRIPYVLPELINEDAYERKKDVAINNIGKKKETPKENKYDEIRKKIGLLPPKVRRLMGDSGFFTPRTLRSWSKWAKRGGDLKEVEESPTK